MIFINLFNILTILGLKIRIPIEFYVKIQESDTEIGSSIQAISNSPQGKIKINQAYSKFNFWRFQEEINLDLINSLKVYI